MQFRAIIFIFAVAFIFFSCVNVGVEPQRHSYSVMFVLSNLDKHQRLYIFKTAPFEESTSFDRHFIEKYVVKDADAELITSEGRFKFKYGIVDSLCYSETSEGLKIFPNSECKLSIKISDGTEITGVTRTPGKVEIIKPSNGEIFKLSREERFRRLYADVVFSLRGGEGAYGYIVNAPYPEVSIWGGYRFVQDTVAKLRLEFDEEFIKNIDTLKLTIKVYAIDTNFYHHAVMGVDKAGIANAYGVFGSMIGDSVMVKFVR